MNTPPLRPTENGSTTTTPGRKPTSTAPYPGTPAFAFLLQGVESTTAATSNANTSTTEPAPAETPAPVAPPELLLALLGHPPLTPAPTPTPAGTGETAAAVAANAVSPAGTTTTTTKTGAPNTPLATTPTDFPVAGSADVPSDVPAGTVTTLSPAPAPVPTSAHRPIVEPLNHPSNHSLGNPLAPLPPEEPTLPTAELRTQGPRFDDETRNGKNAKTDAIPGTGGEPAGPTSDPAMGLMDTGSGTTGDGQHNGGEEMLIWSQAQIKKASLNLQDEGGGSLGIDVSLNQGEAALSFHSEDANLREAIEQGAENALGEMFKDSGLTLAGLSVGTRQPSEEQGADTTVAKRRIRVETTNEDTSVGHNWTRHPGKDPGRALDVYA